MRDSNLEIKIYKILSKSGLPFSEEFEFPDLRGRSGRCLRFDFAVFKDDGSIDFLIEAQGRQHYVPVAKFGGAKGLERQKRNDVAKRRYCLQHGLRLVTIPYYDENRINLNYILRAVGHY